MHTLRSHVALPRKILDINPGWNIHFVLRPNKNLKNEKESNFVWDFSAPIFCFDCSTEHRTSSDRLDAWKWVRFAWYLTWKCIHMLYGNKLGNLVSQIEFHSPCCALQYRRNSILLGVVLKMNDFWFLSILEKDRTDTQWFNFNI